MPNRNDQQAVYLQSGDPTTENVATLAYPGQLGSRFTVIQPTRSAPGTVDGRSKRYQLIQTDSSMAVAPYAAAVAWWADKTRYLVTTSQSKLGRGRIAGVFLTAITPGNYGCVQVEGPAAVKFIDSVTVANLAAVGNFVIPSSTDGKADVLAAGASATYPPLGTTAGTILGGTGTAVVDLNVPETT